MTNQDWTVWEERWKSLSGTMDALIDRYQGLNFSRKTTLHCLVKCLQAFGKGQIDYFTSGNVSWEKSPQYPAAYAFRVTLDQIAYDLEVIQRAAEQRISGSEAMKTALKIADKLAWEALEPVVGQNKLVKDPKTTVVTYFHKSANIRVIPYAPVAMVAIPFTCAPVPHALSGTSLANVTFVAQDYLAIPHEVGHYVYWRGRIEQDAILAKLYAQISPEKPQPLCYFRWVEEIFADIYGCLIAGPWIALDFQDLQLTESDEKDQFIKDDGEHPVPILRPYVYTKVLENMGEQPWAVGLNSYWEDRLTQRYSRYSPPRAVPGKITLAEPKMGSDLWHIIISILWRCLGRVQRDKARQGMLSIVETVHNNFLSNIATAQLSWWQGAKSLASNPQAILAGQDKDRYQKFEDHLRPLVGAPPDLPSERELACDELDIKNLWDNWKNSLHPGLRLPRDPLDIIEVMKAFVAGPDWVDVLHAEGWATKGPHGYK